MFPVKIAQKNAQIGYIPAENERKIHVYTPFMRLIVFLFGVKTVKVQVQQGKSVYLKKKDVVQWVQSKNPAADIKKNSKNQQLIRLVEDICQTQLGQIPTNLLTGRVSSILKSRKTYDKQGASIHAPAAKSYLILEGLEDRFALNIYDHTNAPMECIKISVSGDSFFVDAAEFANRLHLKKSEVVEFAKKGNLSDLISEKKEKLDLLNRIIEDYSLKLEKNNLLKKIPLSPKLLMKVIRTAGKNDLFATTQTGFVVSHDSLKEKIIVTRDDAGKLHMASFTELLQIDKGTYGTVYPVKNPLSSNSKIIKIALEASAPDSVNELRNEFKILNLIHQLGPVPGIQKRLYGIFAIQPAKDVMQYGYLTKKYEMDLHDYIFKDQGFTEKKFLTSFHEVLKGIKHCHELEIVHGDIKLENILVMKKKLYLADFGGACILGKLPGDKFDKGTFTEQYWLKENQDKANEARAKGDRVAFNQALKSRDVYQLGCVLYEVLLNDRLKNLKTIDVSVLEEKNIDPKVISLILKMTDPDTTKRLTIQAAEAELAALLS